MTDRHIIADNRRRIAHDMDRRIVLNVRVPADDDGLQIAADDRIEPDVRPFHDRHIADDRSVRCNERRRVDLRHFAFVRQDDCHANPSLFLLPLSDRTYYKEFFRACKGDAHIHADSDKFISKAHFIADLMLEADAPRVAPFLHAAISPRPRREVRAVPPYRALEAFFATDLPHAPDSTAKCHGRRR